MWTEAILLWTYHTVERRFPTRCPVSSRKFCDAVHPLLTRLLAILCLGFIDDFIVAGDCNAVPVDVQTITDASEEAGLHLNPTKCEIIALDFNRISHLVIFIDFKRLIKEDMTLLGAQVIKVWQSTTHYKRWWMTKYRVKSIITAARLRCCSDIASACPSGCSSYARQNKATT